MSYTSKYADGELQKASSGGKRVKIKKGSRKKGYPEYVRKKSAPKSNPSRNSRSNEQNSLNWRDQ